MPNETESSKTKKTTRCFKLSFIREFSEFIENKFQKFTNQFYKEGTNIKTDFSTSKLAFLNFK